MDGSSPPEVPEFRRPLDPVFSRVPTLPPSVPAPLSPSDPPDSASSVERGDLPSRPPPTAHPQDLGTDEARTPTGDLPPAPRRLVPTRWLRVVVIGTSLTAWVGVFLGSAVGFVLGSTAVLSLISWSGLAVVNVRRARAATVHQDAPHPASAVLWWLAAPVSIAVGANALLSLRSWVDDATLDQEGTRSMIFVGAVAAVAGVVLIAAYVPYGVLRRASRWVSGDSSKMRAWFLAPFIAGFAAVVIQVLAALTLVADAADGTTGGSSTTATAILAAAIGLPIVAWLIYGGRAMIDLEEATRHQHARAVREADPTGAATFGPVNPIVASLAPPQTTDDVSAPQT